MKKIIMKSIAAALTLVLALGCIIPAIGQEQAITAKAEPGQTYEKLSAPKLSRGGRNNADAWKSNLLTSDPLGVLCSKKELITCVTFLDDTSYAPYNAWAIGKGASSRVKGWVDWYDGRAYIYIAANGGINGRDACYELFRGCNNLTEIYFNGAFHTEEAETMQNMFRGCTALEYVDVSTLDTSSAKNMSGMFTICTELQYLDLGNFDTSNVTNMSCMFSACNNMWYVNVSSFDTGRVTNMENMFGWCHLLEEPDVSGWDVSRVRNCSGFMPEGATINGQPWEYFFW